MLNTMKHPLIINVKAHEKRMLYGSLIVCLLTLFWFINSLSYSVIDTFSRFLQPALFLIIATLATYWLALHVPRVIAH
jgi:hypothetical protein